MTQRSAFGNIFKEVARAVLADLLTNRLRFNTFIRVFFQEITVEIDRPGLDGAREKRRVNCRHPIQG